MDKLMTVADLEDQGSDVAISRQGAVGAALRRIAFRTRGRIADAQWCDWQGNAQHTGIYRGTCSIPRGR